MKRVKPPQVVFFIYIGKALKLSVPFARVIFLRGLCHLREGDRSAVKRRIVDIYIHLTEVLLASAVIYACKARTALESTKCDDSYTFR